MIDCQSSLTALRPFPLGTFENSPAIYGWVHRPQQIQSPAGTTEPFCRLARPKHRSSGRQPAPIEIHGVAWANLPSLSKAAIRVSQAGPSCSKPFSEKKRLFIFMNRPTQLRSTSPYFAPLPPGATYFAALHPSRQINPEQTKSRPMPAKRQSLTSAWSSIRRVIDIVF